MRPDVELLNAATTDGVTLETIAQTADQTRIEFIDNQALAGKMRDQLTSNRASTGPRFDNDAFRMPNYEIGRASCRERV